MTEVEASSPKACLARTERALVSMHALLHLLRRRCLASVDASAQHCIAVHEGVCEAARDALWQRNLILAETGKTLDALLEREKVMGEQLLLCSAVIEVELSEVATAWAAQLLAGVDCHDLAPSCFTRVLAIDGFMDAVGNTLHLCSGVDIDRCIAVGPGLSVFLPGIECNENTFRVLALDAHGVPVPSLEESDVCVEIEGASVAPPRLCENGEVEISYTVPDEVEGACADSVTVHVSVLGTPLPASPWIAKPTLASAILPLVSPGTHVAFLRALRDFWLPRASYSLLFRGSRDGMTAAAFHELCDRKGPTLTLIRSDTGYTFGGYASSSWDSSGGVRFCDVAFCFSVEGPELRVARFDVLPDRKASSIYTSFSYGPCFGFTDLALDSGAGADGVWGFHSECQLGRQYEKPALALGLAGERNFTPVEVEVFKVTIQ